MFKNFLEDYSREKITTLKFVFFTIITYGIYATYWLGKLNTLSSKNCKRALLSESLIIVFGIFSCIEIIFITVSASEAIDGGTYDSVNFLYNISYIGSIGLFVMNIVIAFAIKNSLALIFVDDKIKFASNPIITFNAFFLFLFGIMYVIYKFNQISENLKSIE